MKTPFKILRYLLGSIWIGTILACLAAYFLYPESFSAQNIAAILLQFDTQIWLAYLLISALRGLTLLPSTPLVIAGTLLFPGHPFLVLFVSITGILISSSMIYFFSEFLGFSDYFERHKPETVLRIRQRLERPTGFVFVAAWSFFPLVPTDLVCYVAGTLKMNFLKFVSAVLIGELILCSFYIFSGGYLMSVWR